MALGSEGKTWTCSPAAKVTRGGGFRVGFDRVRKSLVIATKDGKAAFFPCFVGSFSEEFRVGPGMQKRPGAAIAGVLGLEKEVKSIPDPLGSIQSHREGRYYCFPGG